MHRRPDDLRRGIVERRLAMTADLGAGIGGDAQNDSDPLYVAMADEALTSLAFRAARALVFEGTAQPNGYTEPLLHRFRAEAKAAR